MSFIEPVGIQTSIVINILDNDPALIFEIPEFEDTGSNALSSNGLAPLDCKPYAYTKTSSQDWIVQDTSNSRSFTINTGSDTSLLDVDHYLTVEISSTSFPSAPVHTFTLTISVQCIDPELEELWALAPVQ